MSTTIDRPTISTRPDAPVVLESCHSTWVFDTSGHRFRRVLKGLDIGEPRASTGWRPYFGLLIDPSAESFTVLLNASGTRLLRSWRHVEHCSQCGGEPESQLSADELPRALPA